MAVPVRYILHQGPVLRALGSGALHMVRQRFGEVPKGPVVTPGPELRAVVPPRPRDLVRDYIRHVGGDPGAYRGVLPPHLFPQWGFGLASRALEGLPYPLARVLNGGCRVEVNEVLPSDAPLIVTARLESVDDDGRRAVLKTRVVTSTAELPNAVVADMFAIVPLGKPGKPANGKPANGNAGGPSGAREAPKEKPRVPDAARELARFRLRANAGLEFAKLTGDFNPVHWSPRYARAFGFRNVILHGFATMARAWEGLVKNAHAGDARAIRTFDCRFTRPLVLPAEVGLYVLGNDVYVGDAPSGPAYLAGNEETR